MDDPTETQTQAPPLPSGSVIRPIAGTGFLRRETPVTRFSADADYMIHLTPEAAEELNELIEKTGDTPTSLIQKAIGLYKVTKRAIQEGKAVGIADDPAALDSNFVI